MSAVDAWLKSTNPDKPDDYTDFEWASWRLFAISQIIRDVENRLELEPWLQSTLEEMTDEELYEIYRLASDLPQKQKETNADARTVESPRRQADGKPSRRADERKRQRAA